MRPHFMGIVRCISNFLFILFVIDFTDYSFLPASLVSMLTYFSMFSTDEGCIPIFSDTKLYLVDPRPNNKVILSRTKQET